MNMCYNFFWIDSQKKVDGLLNFDHEQMYLFYFVGSLEKTTKYNLGGNTWVQQWSTFASYMQSETTILVNSLEFRGPLGFF